MGVRGLARLLAAGLIALALSVVVATALDDPRSLVVVRSDGVVEVVVEAPVSAGLNPVPLPAPPLMDTVYVEVDGRAVPPLIVNNTVYVASDRDGVARITYVVNVTAADGYMVFTVDPVGETVLVVEPGVALLTLPSNVTRYWFNDSTLYIAFTGRTEVRYVVLRKPEATATPAPPAVTETATPAAPAATTTPATGTPTGTPAVGPRWPTRSPAPGAVEETVTETAPAAAPPIPVLPVAAAIAVAGAAAAAILLLLRRRGGGGGGSLEASVATGTELDETDLAILRRLEELGGEALQSQLQRDLNLPKTTLWRRVRRLEALGYVRIVREGRTNRVVLVRKPP